MGSKLARLRAWWRRNIDEWKEAIYGDAGER